MKSIQFALLLALLCSSLQVASAGPMSSKSSSRLSGFSSQRAAPTSSNRAAGGLGSFGGRGAAPAPSAPVPTSPVAGGFGSFGGAAAAPKKSDSALSQNLNKSAAEANALRTLDARRAADQAAKAPVRLPEPASNQAAYGQGAAPTNGGYAPPLSAPTPAPIVIHQNSGGGFGNLVTGFLLGRAMSGSHNNNGYSGQVANSNNNPFPGGGAPVVSQHESSWGMAFLRLLAWLAILSFLAWAGWRIWKFLRRGQGPSTANYSFERS